MTTPSASRIVFRLANDGLVACVDVKPGPPLSESELRSALQAAGIRAGLDDAAIARLASSLADATFAVSAEVVARGTSAEEGEDGYFAPHFREGIQPGHVREDGTLDFHDRELLKPVEKGALLGRIWPARAGVPGRQVDGNVIAARVTHEASLVLGPGAERDAEGVVRAARAGVLDSKPGVSLDVVDHHLHEGPVDLRSGHLHMQGSLVVQGDVTRGFGVHASGDIEIRGNVEAGSVIAGGSVRVQHGVRSSRAPWGHATDRGPSTADRTGAASNPLFARPADGHAASG